MGSCYFSLRARLYDTNYGQIIKASFKSIEMIASTESDMTLLLVSTVMNAITSSYLSPISLKE